MRRRLYRGVVVFAVTFVAGFMFATPIIRQALRLVNFDQVVVATSSPFQYTAVAMDIGYFLAIFVTTPFMVYNLYAFIAPALVKREKILILKIVPVSLLLFVTGFAYCAVILYYAMGLFADINVSLGIANYWNIGLFLSEIMITSALLGLVFQFPFVITVLIKLKIMTLQMLKKNRRIAYFLSLCIVALLPPTDGISLLAMTLPIVLLYEGTILFNK